MFYQWQYQFFENGSAAFARKTNSAVTQHPKTIQRLEANLQRKNEVVSELAHTEFRGVQGGIVKSCVLVSQSKVAYPAERSNSQFSRPTLGMRIRREQGYIETVSQSRPIRHYRLPTTVSGCQRA
jgi:hypothetical protein